MENEKYLTNNKKYGGMDVGGGTMVLGGVSPPADMVFTYSDPIPSYNIELKEEIHVAGKQFAKCCVSSPSDGSKVRLTHKGSPGAFSEAAALKAYPKCKPVPCDQYKDVLKAVDLWLVEKVGGRIHRNYDLLLGRRLHTVGEVKLVVHHCLLALPGVRKEELKNVLSHPQEAAKNNSRVAAAKSNYKLNSNSL